MATQCVCGHNKVSHDKGYGRCFQCKRGRGGCSVFRSEDTHRMATPESERR